MTTEIHTVVQLFDHFHHEGPNGSHTCLVSEIMGPSVAHVVENLPKEVVAPGEPVMPLWMARKIIKQFTKAVSVLHSRGIAHGDLQYGNLLFAATSIALSEDRSSWHDGLTQRLEENVSNYRNLQRVDGDHDPWAPAYILSSAPLTQCLALSPEFRVKLSDLGSCKSALIQGESTAVAFVFPILYHSSYLI